MRVLILGASGMLGHKLWQVFSNQFETYATLRQKIDSYAGQQLFNPNYIIEQVLVENFDSIIRAFATTRPDVVVNCIGVVKQSASAQNPLVSIPVNALFPHRLAQLCQAADTRLIHISTDCVFSGRKGNYREDDVSDADDIYGRTKYLGEVNCHGCLTLRTSIIGRELETTYGLIEWFLNQEGKVVQGYTRAIFSGFTTQAIAKIIAYIIKEHPDMQGIWHVASDPISKFDLLSLVKEIYGLEIQINPEQTNIIDRSLNAEKFRQVTGFIPPSWSAMIEELHNDIVPYENPRSTYVNR